LRVCLKTLCKIMLKRSKNLLKPVKKTLIQSTINKINKISRVHKINLPIKLSKEMIFRII